MVICMIYGSIAFAKLVNIDILQTSGGRFADCVGITKKYRHSKQHLFKGKNPMKNITKQTPTHGHMDKRNNIYTSIVKYLFTRHTVYMTSYSQFANCYVLWQWILFTWRIRSFRHIHVAWPVYEDFLSKAKLFSFFSFRFISRGKTNTQINIKIPAMFHLGSNIVIMLSGLIYDQLFWKWSQSGTTNIIFQNQ